ncbi:MAG: hypothetical protein KA072_00325 [Thermoanaerobaculaceae bacterium]|nr:hypothetical protein [Thermoanaerobaculaceae bacterium]MDI9621303.1 hypothetical protein [Acidobacteriota bacterium]NLH09815.1 hypothetical protein [Holophagae bacterium]HPW54165.1 hypothetical protein [Thermoanaerobaculaceae bacterium]
MRRLQLGLIVGLFGVVMLTGCTSVKPDAAPPPVAQAEVEQVGATAVKYRGPDLELALSYRFADINLGMDWLLVDTAVTGSKRVSVEIKREKISLRTPDGEIVPLPSQEELADSFSSIRAANHRANVAAEPLRYWGGRRECKLNFLVEPGSDIVMRSIWVNDERWCVGRLYFPIMKGVQPGRYELRIDLPESKVRVPFVLGARK